MTAITHRNDPASSHAAARLMESSGARASHIELIGTYVKRHPGLTASQYAELTGLDVVETRRRLTDLKIRHLAFQDGEAKPNGRLECRWFPALSQGALI